MESNIEIIPAFLKFYTEKHRYKFAFGGRGSGKSQQIGIILLVLAAQMKFRILCTREIQKSIKDSVHVLLSDLIQKYNLSSYEVTINAIKNKVSGSEFLFAGLKDTTVESIKSYEGIDYCWIEEAQTVSKRSLSILLPTIRKDNSELWFSFNRKKTGDPVYQLINQGIKQTENKAYNYYEKQFNYVEFKSDNAYGIKINYDGNPFFPKVLQDEMIRDKENDLDLYIHTWLGEPETQSYYSLIKRTKVMEAINRPVQEFNLITFGVDPAGGGDNESVLCIRHGFKIIPMIAFTGVNPTELTRIIIDKAIEIYKYYKDCIQVRIDHTGIGAGVTSGLQEAMDNERRKTELNFNIQVIPVLFGGSSNDSKYDNYTTEMWFRVRDILDQFSLPNDEKLIDQLCSRQYKLLDNGKIRLQSKKDVDVSPDRADAMVLALDTGEGSQPDYGEDSTMIFARR